jgi:hypothetical protein
MLISRIFPNFENSFYKWFSFISKLIFLTIILPALAFIFSYLLDSLSFYLLSSGEALLSSLLDGAIAYYYNSYFSECPFVLISSLFLSFLSFLSFLFLYSFNYFLSFFSYLFNGVFSFFYSFLIDYFYWCFLLLFNNFNINLNF